MDLDYQYHITYGAILTTLAPGKEVVTTGDFGKPSGANNLAPDGYADFVVSNGSASQFISGGSFSQIWYMDGFQLFIDAQNPASLVRDVGGAVLGKSNGNIDDRFIGAGDFYQGDLVTPPAIAGRTDLIIREVTDGRLFYWQMNGNRWQRGDSIRDQYGNQLHWDTEWKVGTEPLPDSTWKISGFDQPALTANAVSSAPPTILLTIVDYPLQSGQSFKIERRDVLPTPSATWTVRASAWTSATYSDSTIIPVVEAGKRYEYRVQAFVTGTSTTAGPQIFTFASVAQTAANLHNNRGEIVLLVETGLDSLLGTWYGVFKDNLVGDGWTVVEKPGMTRHLDAFGANNSSGVATAKSAIPATAKGVIILGHVAIPRSGSIASDNHVPPDGDHRGPWTADAYYGDSDGNWGTPTNGIFPAESIPDSPSPPSGVPARAFRWQN
jgi:hypothetical protein